MASKLHYIERQTVLAILRECYQNFLSAQKEIENHKQYEKNYHQSVSPSAEANSLIQKELARAKSFVLTEEELNEIDFEPSFALERARKIAQELYTNGFTSKFQKLVDNAIEMNYDHDRIKRNDLVFYNLLVGAPKNLTTRKAIYLFNFPLSKHK